MVGDTKYTSVIPAWTDTIQTAAAHAQSHVGLIIMRSIKYSATNDTIRGLLFLDKYIFEMSRPEVVSATTTRKSFLGLLSRNKSVYPPCPPVRSTRPSFNCISTDMSAAAAAAASYVY